MSTIPAPKQVSDCMSIGGLTVCPHVVHLTDEQMETVHKMHLQNVAKVQKYKDVAKRKRKIKAT